MKLITRTDARGRGARGAMEELGQDNLVCVLRYYFSLISDQIKDKTGRQRGIVFRKQEARLFKTRTFFVN